MTGPTAVVTVVVGNPKPGSRTLDAGTALADTLIQTALTDTGPPSSLSIHRGDNVDLATIADGLLAPWRLSAAAAAAAGEAKSSALLILATPTYKASYTGLLKLFLDVFPAGSLAGTVVVPLITSGGEAHRYLGDLQLRPVLSELGAVLPAPSLLLTEPEIGRSADLAVGYARRYGTLIWATIAALTATRATTTAADGPPGR